MNKNRKKSIYIILMCTILTGILTKKISGFISKNVIHSVYILIEKENDISLKKAFMSKIELNVSVDNLIETVKNKNDEIIEVHFDIKKSEEIMNYVTKKMSDAIDAYTIDGYTVFVPLGSVFDWTPIANLGPKIPVKVDLTNVAMGSIRSVIREYGINSALVELYVDIDVKTEPTLITKSTPRKKKYTFLLASKIISGKVPELYNGRINKESTLFNLPVE